MRPSEAYAELSLPTNATHEQIRRAYKRACLRWHPDKHPPGQPKEHAEIKFKAICLAYSRLCEHSGTQPTVNVPDDTDADPFADATYRKRFAEGFAKQFAAEGYSVDAETLFDSLFGDGRRDFEFEFGKRRLSDRVVDLPLTLEELALGCVKKRRVRNEGVDPIALNIYVKPGYRQGDRVRFKNANMDGKNEGDVVFVISLKSHPRFVAKGDDLFLTLKVDLVDALAGVVIMDKGVDGSDLKIRVDTVVYPGYVHLVKGKGLPRRACPENRGDLHVSFDITFPKRIEADDRAAVRNLFARLERNATCRMNMRRSSSLFMSKGPSVSFNILSSRRNSTTMANDCKENAEVMEGEEKAQMDNGMKDRKDEGMRPGDHQTLKGSFVRGKGKLKIGNIFR